MKIILITHWRIPSEKTMAPYMLRVAEAFAREGAKVEFWAPRRVEPLLKGVDPFKYHAIDRIFTIKKLPVLDLMNLNAGPLSFYLMLGTFTVSVFFRALFMRRKDTVFYFFDLRDAWLVHSLGANAFSEIHMYYRSGLDVINRRGFRLMHGIIAATKPLREEIMRDYHVPIEKILHAPCAVNFERFGITTPIEEAREKLGLPQGKTIILYVGHLFPVKGVDVLFDAHPMLGSSEVIYFVGGTDDDIARFQKKWEDAGKPESVVIAGRKPHQDIPMWLRAADVLSIPNTAKDPAGSIESSPSKLIEYMASGRPIVASDVPGIRDVLDEDMGYLCRARQRRVHRKGHSADSRRPCRSTEASGTCPRGRPRPQLGSASAKNNAIHYRAPIMSSDLLQYRHSTTSEHGEEGIINRIFEIIGEQSKWCVDLGALNGVHGSNVRTLIQQKGWSGVLIEADLTQFEKLEKEYAAFPNAHCINAFVSFEGEQSLDVLFAKTPLPHEFDLFSLDIDGNEYHLWESLQNYRPRLMVVEFNPSIPNSVEFVQPRDMTVFQGSSLRSLVELGRAKGYELVAVSDVNAFMVLRELFPLFNIKDNSIETLHTDTSYQTQLYQLYDGTLKLAGNTRFIWHNTPIDEAKLQVFAQGERRYPARIAHKHTTRLFKYYARKLPIYALVQKIRKSLLR
jgi:glycosyltransferase involved in cell wall biosynthesis